MIGANELEEARLHWVRLIQAANYKDELAALRGGKSLFTQSPIVKLTPFVDDAGLLRVGGRLRHAQMPFDTTL